MSRCSQKGVTKERQTPKQTPRAYSAQKTVTRFRTYKSTYNDPNVASKRHRISPARMFVWRTGV